MRPLKALAWLMLPLVLGLVLAMPGRAIEIEFNGGPVRREILAFYDSQREATPQTTRIHQFAEMPLNWLGFHLTYVDVNGPLPAHETLSKYRGIVSWFIEPISTADRYVTWLDEATKVGVKLVVFSNAAPGVTPGFEPVSARVYRRLGLVSTDDHISLTHKVKLTVDTSDIVGFERPLDKVPPDFRVLTMADNNTTAHVTAHLAGRLGSKPAVLIATGPGGGYVSDEYSIVFDANTDRVRWTLNPFLFLKLALAKERMPIPDVTTLSGRRMYFSHIDGDGWNNVSQIDGYRQAQTLSADVIRKDAIEPFPDLPVTVGTIAGDLIPELGGNPAGRDAARKLFALPQVEIGSHTYTHPFQWSFYDSYSRATEEALIDKVRAPELPAIERARRLLLSATGQSLPLNVPGRYIAGSSDLPRTYLKDPFDLTREVAGSLAFAESLGPAGKKAKLFQWSGDCLPFEGAIRATRLAGVANINGGDSRLDANFPSVFYVPPISKPVGQERQIYSANSNENTYTNDWTGPYYGFSMLGDTIRNTELPRRLKPFNLYYHMYSGERQSALAALVQNLKLARQSSLTPVATSHYAAIANDFFTTNLTQLDATSWSIQSRGELQTVRFDDADNLIVDALASKGVLGFTRHASGAIYVSLDPAVESAIVTLKPHTANQIDPLPPTAPGAQLISARWWFRDYQVDGCGFNVTAQGFGAGEMLWQTAPARKFTLTAERDGQILTTMPIAADATGVLQLSIKADAIAPVRLRFACNE